MTHAFDKDYWDQHWQQRHTDSPTARTGKPPNPYLVRETGDLAVGSALDAGCGVGAEAIWLAARGWRVTAVDIAPEALALAAAHAATSAATGNVRWIEADLTVWAPEAHFDLVTTNYAHPAMPQLAFYDRISAWVAPGGTLLIVGHLHAPAAGAHGHYPPAEASVTLADITAGLDRTRWEITTAEEHVRTIPGRAVPLHDVVVRATRRA
ncbi:class I SAM-dependent methyltransferase [Micromonospora avicenniae]|uniref:class I SAM-dependent methyltransferase n=1 Tax=Micromonospora avicenniae TaxID=1198245 RepID=UPI00343FF113